MSRFAIALLLFGLPLIAQPPRGFFPWWDSPVVKDMNLSEDQTKQIRNIVKDYRTKLIDLRATVEKAEVELEDQFSEDTLDQRRANDSIERLVTARAEMTRAFSQMSLRLRAVLTAEQYRELQKRRPRMPLGERRRDMPNRRPASPGGTPPVQQQQ